MLDNGSWGNWIDSYTFCIVKFDLTVFALFPSRFNVFYVTADQRNSINWFPYLQTVLSKLHIEDEQWPSEYWATVVVALEWCQLRQPWQLSRPLQLLSCLLHHFLLQLVLRQTTFAEVSTVTAGQWEKPNPFCNNDAWRPVFHLGKVPHQYLEHRTKIAASRKESMCEYRPPKWVVLSTTLSIVEKNNLFINNMFVVIELRKCIH